MISLANAFEQLLSVLDLLEIPFLIGGSVASGSYGLPRQTNDIDILADFRNADLTAFCEAMQREFYLDARSVSEAIRDGRPFNAIHLKAAFKFDFFPATFEGFSQSELGRRGFLISSNGQCNFTRYSCTDALHPLARRGNHQRARCAL